MSVEQYSAVQVSSFRGKSGVVEHQILIRPTCDGSFENQLDSLIDAYSKCLREMGLKSGSAVFRRYFVSDLANQAGALESRAESNPNNPDEPCAISWVGQAPIPPAKVALWAYHVGDANGLDKKLEGNTLTLRRKDVAHHWSAGLASAATGAGDQTRQILERYSADLNGRGSTLAGSLLRTWFFVRDIDANYRDFVAARRDFFAMHGLTAETHYIASSGIEGRHRRGDTKVVLDAWAVSGLQNEQVQYLSALDHLCPTRVYGVTFERGTAVSWRDRRHVIISGTASIDADGKIVHAGDLERQCGRTLENIGALLGEAGASMRDIAMMIVYVRDTGDFERAEKLVREQAGEIPFQLVLAPVCRPGWLIEIEAIATLAAENPGLPEF